MVLKTPPLETGELCRLIRPRGGRCWHLNVKFVLGARRIPRKQEKNQQQQQHIDQWRQLDARMMQGRVTTQVHDSSGILTVPPRSAQEFAQCVCRTATKAKLKRASKQLPNQRSAFALCRGRKRRTSSLESRWPALRLC